MAAPWILVLEDEPLIAIDLEYTLMEGGFQNVVIATSCENALSYLSQNTPSLAILDFQLKNGTCIEVCRELVLRNVPVIISSASNGSDSDDVFRTVTWLSKPILPTVLLNSVKERWLKAQ